MTISRKYARSARRDGPVGMRDKAFEVVADVVDVTGRGHEPRTAVAKEVVRARRS